jgi:FkbM family methyltransferase
MHFPRRIKQRILNTLTERIVENSAMSRALYRNFSRFDMIFTDVWQEYLRDQSVNVGDKLDVLYDGMDDISKEIATIVADRYFYLAPPCRFDDVVLYRADQLFTNYERELQTKFTELMQIRKKRGYWLPEAHRELSISVFAPHNGIDFIPDARERLLGSSVIDGGAFIGDSALAISEFGPQVIYCFEPDDKNRNYMRETIDHNSLSNVTIVNAGLGSVEGRASVHSDASETRLLISSDGVPVTTVDAFCRQHNVAPALIKLDVEGMEYDVIQGSLETVKQHKPLLIISIYHSPRDFFEIKPILQHLGLGYKFSIRRLDPFHPTNETVLLCY